MEISSSGDSYTLKWTLGTGESYGGVALERDGELAHGEALRLMALLEAMARGR